MEENKIQAGILKLLNEKANLKQHVFDSTHGKFKLLKEVLKNIEQEYNDLIVHLDKRVHLKYTDNGQFVIQLKIAGDVLVFYMHSNTFEFDRDHEVWKLPYAQENLLNSYCGVINIYNFLHDSFYYNRQDDLGYLVARVFINRDGSFFVEGKRQKGMGVNHFGEKILDHENWRKIVETAMQYSLEFDLLVPPYDDMKIVSLQQMNEEVMHSRMQTGKRLGFVYNSDDVK
ncbi:hypothetical protein DMA11_18920 [Marinilabiliaceae bacterium JC017]|nr:hypothetical protein DMA11_18920 [Marinilabiliaceae bacterium JC017]